MYIPISDPVAYCRALGDQTRLRLIRLFAVSQEEACLCELEVSLQEPGYKLSRHLKILRDAGLLEGEKEGRWVYHRLASAPESLRHLWDFVLAQPDPQGLYEADLGRFTEIMCKRICGRCRGMEAIEAIGVETRKVSS